MSEPMLYLDGVSVVFDGFRALNNLSLIVEAGELRAIIGPNGAGKTTMMDVITGKTRPTAGMVRFRDHDLTRLDEATIANLGIGRKFQKPTDVRCADRLREPGAGAEGAARPLLLPALGAGPAPSRQKIEAMMEEVGLTARGA